MFRKLQNKLIIAPSVLAELLKNWVLKLIAIQEVFDANGKITMYKATVGIASDMQNYGKGTDGKDIIGINEMEKFTVNIPHKPNVSIGSIITIIKPIARLWGQNGFLGNLIIDAEDITLAEKK